VRGHMMPPPLHVHNVVGNPANAACCVVCTVKFLKSFATWQHRLDDSNFYSAMQAIMRCVSVRPSVTFVNSVKTNKHIFIFLPSGSQTILVFP